MKEAIKKMKKITAIFTSVLSLFLLAVVPAFAHVMVRPDSAGVASFVTFDMGVPTEKDNPTVAIRLMVPNGLKEVVPNVKAPWKIEVKKNGDAVTEIDWSGSIIPPEQRDDFYFSVQVPADPTTLTWKAYQTYQDGSVVSWDQDPKTIKKGDEGTPYSQTMVVNDLLAAKQTMDNSEKVATRAKWALILSGVALIFSIGSIVMLRKNK